MTGCGRASGVVGGGALAVQVSSVNRRGLDLTVRLPDGWDSLESEVGERIRKVATRGKVHVEVEWAPGGNGAETVWNDIAVAGVLARLRGLAETQGVRFEPTVELLWQVANAQRTPVGRPDPEDVRPVLVAALDGALAEFSSMREREGGALLADFLARIQVLRSHVDAVAERAPKVAPGQRALLMKRLRDAGLELDVADERVLKEIALFADRCDITEEITRFRSHLDQLLSLLRSDGEIGRKADFILQELGREANTMGSKANDLEIARAVIELKNELERVREQLANVE